MARRSLDDAGQGVSASFSTPDGASHAASAARFDWLSVPRVVRFSSLSSRRVGHGDAPGRARQPQPASNRCWRPPDQLRWGSRVMPPRTAEPLRRRMQLRWWRVSPLSRL